MMKSEDSFVLERSQDFVASNRLPTIARKIDEVIVDAHTLDSDKIKGKFIKREMLPPITESYRQNRDIRALVYMHEKVKKEMLECDKNDVLRKNLLEETIKMCETLKLAFKDSEVAHNQTQKEKETHLKLVEQVALEGENHQKALARYLRSGETLVKLWHVMQQTIEENKCYRDFLENDSQHQSIEAVIDKYETIRTTTKDLSERLNQMIEAEQKSKNDLIRANQELQTELNCESEALTAAYYAMESATARNSKFEMALHNISTVSVEHILQLNKVLKSAEQIMENMIANKAIPKSYRKKTLAQLFEAIRVDYEKKKAILHQHARSKEKTAERKSRRLKMYEQFEERHVASGIHEQTVKELARKKRMITFKQQEERYLKYLKRAGQIHEEDKEYNVLDDCGVILEVGNRPRLSSVPDIDDYEDEKDDESVNISQYSSEGSDVLMQSGLDPSSSSFVAVDRSDAKGSALFSVGTLSTGSDAARSISLRSLSPELARRRKLPNWRDSVSNPLI